MSRLRKMAQVPGRGTLSGFGLMAWAAAAAWTLGLAACAGQADTREILPVSGTFGITQDALGSLKGTLALGDCNGDGLLDLFDLSAGGAPELALRLADGQLSALTSLKFGNPRIISNLAVSDLDGDGNLDLLLAADSLWVARGRGDCTFEAPVQVSSVPLDAVTQIHVTDVDLDGLPDVTLTIDGPKEMPKPVMLLLNRGDGTFDDRSPTPTPWQQTGPYYTYGSMWGDFDGDGTRDLMTIIDFKMAWMAWGIPGDLPSFRQDQTVSGMVSGRCAMAAAALDYDRDGTMDYFVAHDQPGSALLSFHGRKAVDHAAAAYLTQQDTADSMDIWSTYAFDADLDGWVDLFASRIVSSDTSPGPAVFWHNNHDGTFVNLRKQVLPHVETKARSMTCGDVTSHARVVCYATDNFGTMYSPVVAFENHLAPQGNWVGIRLRGTVSSPDADGALIARSGANPPQVLYYGTQSPARAQHDRAVLLAIGSETSTDVDVTWPSGLHQHVSALSAGTYTTITEPQVLTLTSRVLPADGQQAVEVTVDTAPLGTDVPVDIEMTGEGSWAGDMERQGSVCKRMLNAAFTPGDARIQVTLGGTPLLVRPRILFTAQ